MIREVVHVHLNVINMERAIRFYTEILGATVMEKSSPIWSRLKVGSLEIGLLITDDKAPFIQRGKYGSRGGATLTLLSTNIGEDRQRLHNAGVTIFLEKTGLWGHYLLFEDTEGNVHRLLQPLSAKPSGGRTSRKQVQASMY